MNLIAVLTGDLIGSSEAPQQRVEAAMAKLATTTRQLAPIVGLQNLHFTRFRGDGWQALAGDPKFAYFVAAYVLATLRASNIGIGTRIGIGVGSILTKGTRDLSDARGEAFVLSGHALDELDARDVLSLQTSESGKVRWQAALLDTLAFLAGRWSVEQAQAVAMKLERPSDPLITFAQQIGISRQAFSDRLSGAGWRPIESALDAFGTFEK